MGFALSDIRILSSAFEPGGSIPTRHTGASKEDVSPALSWSQAPDGTKAFALFCHDPDAPLVTENGAYGFVHWVLYNIPATTDSIEEGSTAHTRGLNNFGTEDYKGPLPPEGHGIHHYYFWILALDSDEQLPAGLSLNEMLARLEPHIIGMNRLIGTYQRV